MEENATSCDAARRTRDPARRSPPSSCRSHRVRRTFRSSLRGPDSPRRMTSRFKTASSPAVADFSGIRDSAGWGSMEIAAAATSASAGLVVKAHTAPNGVVAVPLGLHGFQGAGDDLQAGQGPARPGPAGPVGIICTGTGACTAMGWIRWHRLSMMVLTLPDTSRRARVVTVRARRRAVAGTPSTWAESGALRRPGETSNRPSNASSGRGHQGPTFPR